MPSDDYFNINLKKILNQNCNTVEMLMSIKYFDNQNFLYFIHTS